MASKQEEIREGIAKQLLQGTIDARYGCPQKDLEGNPSVQTGWASEPDKVREHYLQKADQILIYLHSQGVVIKVDRELPEHWGNKIDWRNKKLNEAGKAYSKVYYVAQEDMLKAGYVAVEPLIVNKNETTSQSIA